MEQMADAGGSGTNQARMILGVNMLTMFAILFSGSSRRSDAGSAAEKIGSSARCSGLLLTGSWLVVGVLYAAPAIAARTFDIVPDAGSVAMSQAGGLTMASLVTTRLEAVFIVSTTTVGRLSEAFPHWLVLVGDVVGLVLLLVPVPNLFVTWVFPVWVATTSAMLIRRDDIKVFAAPPIRVPQRPDTSAPRRLKWCLSPFYTAGSRRSRRCPRQDRARPPERIQLHTSGLLPQLAAIDLCSS
jgi:hypothetical protein